MSLRDCGSDDGSEGEDCVIGVGKEVAGVGEGTEGRWKAENGFGLEVLMVVGDGPGLGKRDGTRLDGECVCGSDDGSEGENLVIGVGEEARGRGSAVYGVERGIVVVVGSGADGGMEGRTRLDGESACRGDEEDGSDRGGGSIAAAVV